MNKLKVAVGIKGRFVLMEKFPDDEEHAGLHEMLEELLDAGIEVEESPGMYLASFTVEQTNPRDPSDVEAYLDFKLEPLESTTNVVNLDEIRISKQSDDNLQHIVSAWNAVTPEQAAELEEFKKQFNLERQHAAALNPEITLGDLDKDEFDSKDIYLETFIGPGKIRQVVGLHAIGHAGQYQYDRIELDQSRTTISTDFQAIEVWGNEYDAENSKKQMIGRGSFRVHNSDIDNEAKQWEAEGWKRIENPWKTKNASKT